MIIDFERIGLSIYEKTRIKQCLNMLPDDDLDQKKIWYLLDEIWNFFQCDNRRLDLNAISRFYAHPVWLLNGLFIENDAPSMGMRHLISKWVTQNARVLSFNRILDYGGGFGTLARLIAQKNGRLSVDIFEPHPADLARKRLSSYPNVSFLDAVDTCYDVLLCIDVLEHVPDPLWTLSEMIASVRPEGHLLFGNNFTPVVKCHLPTTFHLRYMFNTFAILMGLEFCGIVHDTHVTIYKKTAEVGLNWNKIRNMERLSKFIFPFLRLFHYCYRNLIKNHNKIPYIQGFMFWNKANKS